jgi:hypothetical protein
MIEIAIKFGESLDKDEFYITMKLLSPDCHYKIGSEILTGPKDICYSYEQNAIQGRKKLDKLEWGQSKIETINNNEYFVHFTDYLTHKGITYTHKCKQRLIIKDSKITFIEHIEDDDEKAKLNEYYRKVGILTN